MAYSSRFWDRIAAKYARSPIKDEASYQRKLEWTREYLTPESIVYEFGCGTGSTAIAQAPFASHITASDISANMLDIARDKAMKADVPNVTFEQAGLEDANAASAHYDMVMAHSLLHLLEDKEAGLAEIHRMLKPGGIFVSSTACIADFMPLLRLVSVPARWLGLIPLVSIFSSDHLRQSIKAAGFTIVQDWQPKKSASLFIIATKDA